MRISTSNLYQTGLTRLSELQSSLAKIQQQLATNKRIVSPSDDPVASSRALEVSQSKAVNERLAVNRNDARSSLQLEESSLTSVTSMLHGIKTAIIEAGNGALNDSQRQFIATDLKNKLDDLVGLANSRDGEGNYLFAGYQSTVQPFVQTAAGVQYVGDQGLRMLQVGQARQMAISDTGHALFMNVAADSALRSTASASNTGSAVMGPGAVLDRAALTGHSYSIDISGGGTTYDIYDLTADPTKSTSLASGSYSSGAAIQFDGIQVSINGTVNDGDAFTVQPSPTQDMFATLNNLISVLNKPIATPADRKALDAGLSIANGNMDKVLDNVLTVRASLGSRLDELDSLDTLGEDLGVQYESSLESLTGLDIAKAITDLTLQKTSLEAAQQSFVKISNLSLFNYIN